MGCDVGQKSEAWGSHTAGPCKAQARPPIPKTPLSQPAGRCSCTAAHAVGRRPATSCRAGASRLPTWTVGLGQPQRERREGGRHQAAAAEAGGGGAQWLEALGVGALWEGWNERVDYDPSFPAKVLAEQVGREGQLRDGAAAEAAQGPSRCVRVGLHSGAETVSHDSAARWLRAQQTQSSRCHSVQELHPLPAAPLACLICTPLHVQGHRRGHLPPGARRPRPRGRDRGARPRRRRLRQLGPQLCAGLRPLADQQDRARPRQGGRGRRRWRRRWGSTLEGSAGQQRRRPRGAIRCGATASLPRPVVAAAAAAEAAAARQAAAQL